MLVLLTILCLLPVCSLAALRRGDKGEDVRSLQQMLFETGWLFEEPDSIFGRNTESAVKDYERYAGLPADGVAGVPRAELIGDNEVFLEHYRGILAYGKEEIHVDGGGWVLRILGRNLEIKAMRAGELRIFGVVTSLTLL